MRIRGFHIKDSRRVICCSGSGAFEVTECHPDVMFEREEITEQFLFNIIICLKALVSLGTCLKPVRACYVSISLI